MITSNIPSVDVFYYCYNQATFVERALDSIVAQKIALPVRLIICDDFSSDNSRNVIKEWIESNRDLLKLQNVTVEDISHKSNAGQVATLKEGLALSTGSYLAILEGDDYWIRDDHLSSAISHLDDSPFYSAVFSSWISIDYNGTLIEFRSPPNEDIRGLLFDFNRLTVFNAPGTLSCMVYRGSTLRGMSLLIARDVFLSDFSLNLLVSTRGPIYWSSNYSVVYTFDPKSLWRKISTRDQKLMRAEIIENTLELLNFSPSKELSNWIGTLRLSRRKERLLFLVNHPLMFGRAAILKILRGLRNG